MENNFYLCIYQPNKNLEIKYFDNFTKIYSDDFIAIYLVEKINENYYKIIKTIYCEHLQPFSPQEIFFYNNLDNKFVIKSKINGIFQEIIINDNIFIHPENMTAIYNRHLDKQIKELYYSLVNHYNNDYDLIRDSITYYLEK